MRKDFARDAAQKDFTSFTSGKYVWNVDSGLTLDKFDSVVPVNLLIKGKKADKIVVKNCDVDAKSNCKSKPIINAKNAGIDRPFIFENL